MKTILIAFLLSDYLLSACLIIDLFRSDSFGFGGWRVLLPIPSSSSRVVSQRGAGSFGVVGFQNILGRNRRVRFCYCGPGGKIPVPLHVRLVLVKIFAAIHVA